MDSPVEAQLKEEETDETLAAKPLKNKTLQTKTAVKFLLEGKLRNHVCRYCLNVDSCLWELDRLMTIAIKGTAYTVSIRTMVASFHHIKVSDDPNFPIKICETCLEQTLTCYIFSQQCERAERALRNCFDDIEEKISKLDPIEQNIKKRGRQKLNPNYNTLYASHENVIDYAEPIISLINATSSRTEEVKTEINPNECTKCWQEFSTITLLKNHEKIHPKSMWFHCRFCGKSFSKSNHLKKHINSAHKKPIPKPTEPENFKCKECGNVSGQYLQHLQHVESHKFKTFINHLVENKLNKLCAICLDNKMGLTDMDKMVCFHGGIPGLNGDIHLKSILRSTITNKNMNKYQELHVPKQASVLKISNKRIEKKEAATKPLLPTSSRVIFSKPLIIDEENCAQLVNTSDVYIFSEPIKEIMPLVNESKISESSDKSVVQKVVQCQKLTVDCENETQTLNSDSEQANCDKTAEIPKICTKCWVFGKPCSCFLGDSPKDTTVNEKCSYCWIFKHTSKCFYCNKLSTPVKEIIEINLKPTVPEENLKSTVNEHINNTELNTNNRKRRFVEEANVIALKKRKSDHKTALWLCEICLTKNTENKQKCLCCDAEKVLNDNTKFNFSSNTYVFNSKEDSFGVPDISKVTEDISTIEPDSNVDVKLITPIAYQTFGIGNNADNETEMDIEQTLLNANDLSFLQDSMEICNEDNDLLNTSDRPMCSLSQQYETINNKPDGVVQNLPNVTFTIGLGSAKTKKRLNRKVGTSRN